jgi:zinc/manganese transport system substrate-binding protein
MLRLLIVVLALLAATPAVAAERVIAVASFSILGDLVSRVGGERVEVTTIVGPGSDAHIYEPKPDDAKAMAAAAIVLVNGLGFEGWMERLVQASGYGGTVVTVTDGVAVAEGDPHAWQDAGNAAIIVDNIAKALCAADLENCAAYEGNAASYRKELAALDQEIKAALAQVPSERRVVITSHDAFGYFARAYGVTFLAPEGVSTESEASAKDVAKLIAQIRADKASALFIESISDPRLIEQIARETGVKIGGELYSDALSPKHGPAATYLDMMRHNARMLTAAMRGS